MKNPVQVLVTGSSGRLGQAAVQELQRRGHHVRGFDRVRTPGLTDCVTGDLGDRAAIDRAMQGIECLVHLAATPDDADVLNDLIPNNIVGLYHVMESARSAGVRRIVLASSGQVNWWDQLRGDRSIRPTDAPAPKYWYAATKMFMESIGRSFAEVHGISVISVRLGWCPRTRAQVEEIASLEWAQDVYLSPADAGRFLSCTVEAPSTVRHTVVFATSQPARKTRFDLSEAIVHLGYRPQECWPMGTELIV